MEKQGKKNRYTKLDSIRMLGPRRATGDGLRTRGEKKKWRRPESAMCMCAAVLKRSEKEAAVTLGKKRVITN